MFMKNIFHGRLTKDIELKKTNSGISVCRFQLACDRYAGSKKGTITEYPSFVAWQSVAERLANNTQKGSELLIDAQYTSYKKEIEGQQYPITMVEFEVQNFEFCGSKRDRTAGRESAPAATAEPRTSSNDQTRYVAPSLDDFQEIDGDEDDLPF